MKTERTTARFALRMTGADADAVAAIARKLRDTPGKPFSTRTDAIRFAVHDTLARLNMDRKPTA